MVRGDLTSLGRLAATGAADYFALQEAAGRVAPTLILNGTRYYGPAAVRRLVEVARAAPAEIQRRAAGSPRCE